MKPASNKTFSFDLPNIELPKRAIQMVSVCIVAAAISACGSSSGGTSGGEVEGGSGDDIQGFLDIDADTDGDGISDADEAIAGTDPNNQDTDGDNLFDGEEALTGTDPLLEDTDGNGVNDADEDPDADGFNNLEEIIAGSDPLVSDGEVVTNPDPVDTADQCDDPNSSNASWSDNCVLQRFGTYANSLYVQGVQRILWCQGFGGTSSIGTYADGIFGPGTQEDMRTFQEDNFIAVDGIVGPETWGTLFDKLSLIPIEIEIAGTFYSQWSVDGCSSDAVQFYQELDGIEPGGWKMAAVPGSDILIDFSNAAAR